MLNISPETKDYDRARNLLPDDYKGDPYSKIATKARTQAASIKDKAKLVRRSAAVAYIWGDTPYFNNAWEPFSNALTSMGFPLGDIIDIRDFNARSPRGKVTKQVPTKQASTKVGKVKF